ncbi:guanine nucleotide binding protein, alpha subunit [Mycena maculata]|uniref:Guanine nucleotide binding protein, alpha subunit n=1 Tax=Mycena maculata TaxID=230809 RepID=A0AAD7N6H1_9AGAR|nr:guanine nucleotide binding protein, alpha subunit [Mycena maculata]
MGQPVSKDSRAEKARSDAIDREIASDSKRYKKECKILLLGSGESGKSTIVKQMKIIHQAGFDDRARAEFRYTIYRNVLDSAATLARVVRRVGVPALGDEGRWAGELLHAFPPLASEIDSESVGESAESGDSFGIGAGGFGAGGMGRGGGGVGLGGIEKGEVQVGVDPVPWAHGSASSASDEGAWGELSPLPPLASAPLPISSNGIAYNGGRRPSDWALPAPSVRERRPSEWDLNLDLHRGGIQTGRVSARAGTSRPGTGTGPGNGGSGEADVLAQTHAVLTPSLADAIWHISRVPAVERVVDESPAEFYLMDSAGYFFSQIHRIAAPTYVPSEEDVLRARAKSTAIIETRFWMGDLSIHMFDVGGQRSERKKWIHCFESVTSIIFCTALSEYDQVLEEERRVNRMRESLYLFESVINSRWFLRTSVILFLNKIDVFKRKLPKIPLGRYFPEYAGGSDLQKAAKYILWKFMQENRAKLTVYPHVTQATNTKNIRLVFAAVKETILQNALKDSGIL